MKPAPIEVFHAIMPDGREVELEKSWGIFCSGCTAIGYCACFRYVDLCAGHPFFKGLKIKRPTGQRMSKS